ncbi:MAG: peptidylprolyl isomerase [Gemmatimonadota bacterium]
MNTWKVLIPGLVLVLGACESPGRPSGEDVVARAAGFEFTAQTAAEILAPQSQLPNQPEVVEALADLWVQYYLLARAAAEDTTLMNIDVAPLVRSQVEGDLVFQLRERVIQVDTVLPEEELRLRYESELPGGRIRARHILLQFPEGASAAQVDSVREMAGSLRSRILGGEDFEGLARQFSQDPGTGANGGDLGTFGKNEMVPPFEAAAFALEVGELSEIVETTFGLHLIRVDERIVPPFEERLEQFRAQIQSQLVMEAESTFVANLVQAAKLETDTASFETVRQVAAEPDMELTGRALARALVRYDGGALTLAEFREWLLTSPANVPAQVQAAPDEQIDNLLQSLARSELLVNRAIAEGIEIPSARQDSMAMGILTGVRAIAQELGFFQLTPQEGESLEAAADRVVRDRLVQIVQQGREVFPLQTGAYALKEQYGARIFQPGIAKAVQIVNEIRSQIPPPPAPALPVAPTDTLPPDTAGVQG